jgi:ABC-type oligopeptide transport system substrate-binding subunit
MSKGQPSPHLTSHAPDKLAAYTLVSASLCLALAVLTWSSAMAETVSRFPLQAKATWSRGRPIYR